MLPDLSGEICRNSPFFSSREVLQEVEEKLKAQVRECLIGLEVQACAGKRLRGDLKENCSLRVGKLRVIYTVSEKDEIIYVVAMGPRKTVYQ